MKELMGVGSLAFASKNLFVLVAPTLTRYGVRLAMIIGSVLVSLGMALSGLATELWQLYLTWGLLLGLGSSLIYTTTVNLITQWFSTRKATATGISSCGTGIGGLFASNLVNFLTVRVGIAWTCYIFGFIMFGVCILASCLARPCQPPIKDKQDILLPFKWNLLKDTNFIIAVVGLASSCAASQIPLYLLPEYCIKHNIGIADASLTAGIILASNTFGQIFLGYVADRYGHLITFISTSSVAGLFCLLLWPFAGSFKLIVLFAVLFGMTGSIYYVLAAPIVVEVVGKADMPSAISFLFLFTSIASITAPIASIVLEHTPNENYLGVQILAGALYITSSILCLSLKVKTTN